MAVFDDKSLEDALANLTLLRNENFRLRSENEKLRAELDVLKASPASATSFTDDDDDEKEDEKKARAKKARAKIHRIREKMRVGKITANNLVYIKNECNTTVMQKNVVKAYKEYLVFHNKPVKDDMTFDEMLEDMKAVLKI